jgi:hypothetical protein
MRITKDMLQKSAKDAITIRLKTEKDMVAAYLVGSVLWDEPLIGGYADIDLILVHANPPTKTREIVRVYDEVTLDILHHCQDLYLQPREMRSDPWLGYSVQNHPQLLYDVRHWFEFTQASVGSQFYRPDLAVGRARKLSTLAREIWTELHQGKKSHADRINEYLRALESAGNAIACLSGPPLPERRFSLELRNRFQAIGQAEMMTGFNYLLGIDDLSADGLHAVLTDWEQAYDMAGKQESCPVELGPIRKDYYLKAIHAMLDDGGSESVAMLLLQTWTRCIRTNLSTTPEYDEWLKAMSSFHLGKEDFADRLNSLDHFLDRLDEALDGWALKNGA